MRMLLWLCLAAWLGLALGDDDESFYSVLGIEKDADNRAIRRAYKKLAMHYHPDKNKEDGAHELFVRINRAYEVLKDEDLRKKYDTYGEEGLKDDFQPNPGPSWQFFQTFGIYDEDTEIATLTRADFVSSVIDSGFVWFVNFYSTHCSHCHHLAPTWRKVGIELDSIVRIGAVNCAEDPVLCQEQGVQGYPALIFYPERVMYQGPREQGPLVEFVLDRVSTTLHNVRGGNVEALTTEWEPYRDLPWLLQMVQDTNRPPIGQVALKKLGVMLSGLVNVGSVDCASEEELCDRIRPSDADAPVLFFPPGNLDKAKATVLEALDPQELGSAVLHLLPDFPSITAKEFQERDESEPLMVHFVSGKDGEVATELRKLPSLLHGIEIVRLNCSGTGAAELCARLQISKTPAFAVFKSTGGHEIYHGAQGLAEVAAFAKESARTSVRVILDAEDFASITDEADRPYMIDFFAPWCPPCLRLLPELRKASALLSESVGFATVDCTVLGELCQSVAVSTYPTAVLFNVTQRQPFVGLHTAEEIIQFIEDVQNPPVEELTPDSFKEKVEGRVEGVTWLVDFFAPWSYQNYFRDAGNLRVWASQFLPSNVQLLTAATFSEVLEDETPWLVVFSAPAWCGPCQLFAPEFEVVAKTLQGRLKAGTIDCDLEPGLCQSASVQMYPTLRFYGGSKGGQPQDAPGTFHIGTQNAQQIITTVTPHLPPQKPNEQAQTSSDRDEL